MLTSACPWSWPTSGAGRSSARRRSASPGTVARACGCGRGRSAYQRRSRASSAGGSSRSLPPGCSVPLPAGTSGQGPSNAGKPTASARRRHRDLVAQLHLHPELEARRARTSYLRPRREPGPARARPPRDLPSRPRDRGPDRHQPEAEAGLLRWRAERAPVAARVNTHRLYRKAEGIEEHLVRVPFRS